LGESGAGSSDQFMVYCRFTIPRPHGHGDFLPALRASNFRIKTMQLIGIVGGVASGKSTVAAAFEALGAGVLNADRAGHEVLREPEVMAAIRERWGEIIPRKALPSTHWPSFAGGSGTTRR
jgi:ABC-type glutathione transport system ATPase component